MKMIEEAHDTKSWSTYSRFADSFQDVQDVQGVVNYHDRNEHNEHNERNDRNYSSYHQTYTDYQRESNTNPSTYRLRELEYRVKKLSQIIDDIDFNGVLLKGWICPKCSSVLSPDEKRCYCQSSKLTIKESNEYESK